MLIEIPHLPHRPAKPRNIGLTMVMDKGLSYREAEDMISVSGIYVDFVKLGFGTSLVTPEVHKKILLYKEAGLRPYLGGTLFEAFIVRNMFDEYFSLLRKLDLDMVEVSDGSFEIDQKDKVDYIKRLADSFLVISEVGSKKSDVIYTPEEWIGNMQSELDAGSFKVIAEARESGTTGIYNGDGSANTNLIDRIAEDIDLDSILWEAPLKSQQTWFIKQFGANVNLGNIAPSEVIALETLRTGLRGDTFFQFLPDSMK
ncbi:MAG TPA: phosphosulfolactate synthase [Bacteroidales bacterium]|nr:phosphosulfolactate synthase [Bacteroidales bacterium]